MDYLTTDGRLNRIIGQYSVNESVQFTGIPEIWVSSLRYISNSTITDATILWGWTGTDSHSTNSTGTGIWGSLENASPANSLRCPICSRVIKKPCPR